MNVQAQALKAEQLRKMHSAAKMLVLPNAWDVASARIVEELGFPAIATTSAGIAATLGYPDGQRISRDEMLGVVARIAKAVHLPVTADVEAGYGMTVEDLTQTVKAVVAAGAVGINLEDVTGSDESRVIQGIVTGVGFLGAGVIVRSEKGHHVQGLTTAACVWVTACLGAACAVAQWQIVVVGVVLVFIILALGGRFEKAIDRRWPGRPAQPAAQSPENAHLPSAEETDPSTHR